ncbi:hypothetical protein [Pseudomonas alabamensis]|uniref:hypothetical protein n=1 Tax=Pseudomonas alabamensis TaxID=3064349 RepID=UPI003F65455E
MNNSEIQVEVESLLVANFSRSFWVRAQDNLHAAYGTTHEVLVNQLKIHKHELPRALAQARHYKLSSSLREVAETDGLEVLDLKADHSGENYVALRSGPLQLGRIGVNQGSSLPRGAKHRALIAALNARLEGVTHDLFAPTVHMLPSKTLGLLLVNVNPKPNLDQARMIDLQVGVPFSDLSGWHYLQSCSKIISCYGSMDQQVPASKRQSDNAIVNLKKAIAEIEKAASRETS